MENSTGVRGWARLATAVPFPWNKELIIVFVLLKVPWACKCAGMLYTYMHCTIHHRFPLINLSPPPSTHLTVSEACLPWDVSVALRYIQFQEHT